MELTDEQVSALEALGEELAKAGWNPSKPFSTGFGIAPNDPPRGLVKLALAYIAEYEAPLRLVVCDGNQPKVELLTTTAVASAIADGYQASGGQSFPAWTVANALCQLGITKFCARPPRRGKQDKVTGTEPQPPSTS